MIQFNRCNLQYIRETKRLLKDRLNEHRRTIDAAKHFLLPPDHTANGMQLITIEKISPNRDSIRKTREALFFQKDSN